MAPLRDRHTFGALRERGRRFRSGALTVRHVALDDDQRTFVAFAVGRHAGSAVVRNRIRRRLRVLVREAHRDRRLPPGAIVISARPSVATAPFAQVRRDLDRALAGVTTPSDPPEGR